MKIIMILVSILITSIWGVKMDLSPDRAFLMQRRETPNNSSTQDRTINAMVFLNIERDFNLFLPSNFLDGFWQFANSSPGGLLSILQNGETKVRIPTSTIKPIASEVEDLLKPNEKSSIEEFQPNVTPGISRYTTPRTLISNRPAFVENCSNITAIREEYSDGSISYRVAHNESEAALLDNFRKGSYTPSDGEPQSLGFNNWGRQLSRQRRETLFYYLIPASVLVTHEINKSMCSFMFKGPDFNAWSCNLGQTTHNRLKRSLGSYSETNDYKKLDFWDKMSECKREDYEMKTDTNRICRSWQDWTFSRDHSKLCSYGLSCRNGQYWAGLKCVDHSSNVDVANTCSLSKFQISTSILQPENKVMDYSDPEICSIEGYKIKDCSDQAGKERREISYVGYNRASFLVTRPHRFDFLADYADLNNYVCNNCSGEDCKKCSGSPNYMESFGNAIGEAPCHCNDAINPSRGKVNLIINHEVYPVDFRFSKKLHVRVNKIIDTSLKPSCTDCKFQCENSKLIITGTMISIDSMKICISNYCEFFKASSEQVLPTPLLLLNQELTIQLLKGTEEITTAKFRCIRKDMCSIINCVLCYKKLSNHACFGILEYILVLSILLMLLLVFTLIVRVLQSLVFVIMAIRFIVSMIRTLTKVIWKLFRACLGTSFKKTRKTYESLEHYAEIGEEPLIPVETRSRPKFYARPGPLLTVVCIMMFFSSCLACSKVTSYQFSESDCTVQDNHQVCTTRTKLQLFLTGLGTDSCLSLTKNGQPLGSINIELVELRARCHEELLYWTIKPNPKVQKRCHCWGSGLCKEDDCKDDSLTQEQGDDLKGRKEDIIGISGCHKVNSDFFSKCVGLDGCCIYRAGFTLTEAKDIYKVSKCSSLYYESVLRIKTKLSAAPASETELVLIAGQVVGTSGVEVSFTNPSQPWNQDTSKCILENLETKEKFLVNCNDKDEWVKGKVGEIKCPNHLSPQTNMTHCNIAHGLVTLREEHSTIGFSFQATLPKVESLISRVPSFLPDYTINGDKKGIWFSRSFSETLIVHLNLPSVRIQTITDQASCEIKWVNSTGCHNCVQGVKLTLWAKCSLYPSIGLLTCDSLNHPTPFVVTQEGHFTLKSSSSVNNLYSDCQWIIGRSNGTFIIDGDLLTLTYSEINGLSETLRGDSESSLPLSWSSKFKMNFFNLLSMLKTWGTLGLGFSIVGILLAIWIYCKCYLTKSSAISKVTHTL